MSYPTQSPPDGDDELAFLLTASAGQLYRSADPAAFLDWLTEAGPLLVPSLAARIDPATGPAGQFFRLMGVQIYNHTPLPENGFKPRPIPTPKRNQPCVCGSGRKYKHCCINVGDQPLFENYNMLRHMLDQYPQKALADLPKTAVDTEAVADTAEQWLAEGDTRRALALLEPWFKAGQRINRRQLPLFDLLMEIYLEEDNPIKRKRVLEQACNAEDRFMRAVAWQRKATILADAGDEAAAWDAFVEAQRLDPDSPSLSFLELTLLCTTGEVEQARERAAFWLARLKRGGDAPPELLDLLAECTHDPEAALFGAPSAVQALEDVARLVEMLQAAPPPAACYQVECYGQEAMLVPGATMGKLEAEWIRQARAFDDSPPQALYDEPDLWDTAPRWLPLLQRQPELWHSFQVLDDLVAGIEGLGDEEQIPLVLEALLDRACALLDYNLQAAEASSDYTLPWGMLENRPALRLLAQGAFHAQALEGYSPVFFQRAEQLMRLNPNDNQGMREILSTAYIANHQFHEAIKLAEQFQSDMLCTLPLNQVLALYLDDRKDEALRHLSSIAERFRVAIDMLLAENPDPPEFSGYGVRLGGEDEAWLYREFTLALWRRDGALDWLRQTVRALRRKPR